MNQLTEAAVTILTLIVGVAILAIIISTRSNTPAVLQSLGSMFSNALGVAISPVTGSQVTLNTSYPTSQMGAWGGMNIGQTLAGTGIGVPY